MSGQGWATRPPPARHSPVIANVIPERSRPTRLPPTEGAAPQPLLQRMRPVPNGPPDAQCGHMVSAAPSAIPPCASRPAVPHVKSPRLNNRTMRTGSLASHDRIENHAEMRLRIACGMARDRVASERCARRARQRNMTPLAPQRAADATMHNGAQPRHSPDSYRRFSCYNRAFATRCSNADNAPRRRVHGARSTRDAHHETRDRTRHACERRIARTA